MNRSGPVKNRAAGLVLLIILAGMITIHHHPSSESPGSSPDQKKANLRWFPWWTPWSGTDLFPPVEPCHSLTGSGDKNSPSRVSFSREEFAEGVALHTTDPAKELIAVASSSRFAVVDRQRVLEAFHGETLDKKMESKIDDAIRALSLEKSLTLVFDSSFETSSGSPFLTAGARIEDLTADVISILKTKDLP